MYYSIKSNPYFSRSLSVPLKSQILLEFLIDFPMLFIELIISLMNNSLDGTIENLSFLLNPNSAKNIGSRFDSVHLHTSSRKLLISIRAIFSRLLPKITQVKFTKFPSMLEIKSLLYLCEKN